MEDVQDDAQNKADQNKDPAFVHVSLTQQVECMLTFDPVYSHT